MDETNEEEEIIEGFDDHVQCDQTDNEADIFISAMEGNDIEQHFAM